MQTVTATEFKATCLDLFDQVASGAIDGIAITKRGRVVGVLRPPEPPVTPASVFGHMRGTVVITAEIDLTAPIAPEFDAADGILHR